MFKINILGSIATTYVLKHNKESPFLVNKHFLSVNPLSIIKNAPKERVFLSAPFNESCMYDINKTVFSELLADKGDYLIIDLIDCRLRIKNIKFNNSNILYTVTSNSEFDKKVDKSTYSLLEEINPNNIEIFEWKKTFEIFVSKILEIYTPQQIIVLEAKNSNILLSKNKTIYNLGNQKNSNQQLMFFDKLYTIFKLCAPDFLYIPCPDIWYCDENLHKSFPFHYSNEYYEYAYNCLMLLPNDFNAETINKLCETCSQTTLLNLRSIDPREKKWSNVTLKNFCGVYKDDFNNYIDTNGHHLNLILFGSDNKVIFSHNEINSMECFNLTLGNNNKVTIGNNFTFYTNVKVELCHGCEFILCDNIVINENFTLSLKKDSSVNFGTKTIINKNLTMRLNNKCKIIIGNNNFLPSNSEFFLFDNAELFMGNNNSFYKNINITCHNFTKILIFNDTLWSSDIELINGDGHSIFNIENKKKINDMQILPQEKNTITINNHVWIGRRVVLLNGANIGEGSIIGASSLVKKAFPNNCIVAGCPAKLIKHNICWCRDNSIKDIVSCDPYINYTQE